MEPLSTLLQPRMTDLGENVYRSGGQSIGSSNLKSRTNTRQYGKNQGIQHSQLTNHLNTSQSSLPAHSPGSSTSQSSPRASPTSQSPGLTSNSTGDRRSRQTMGLFRRPQSNGLQNDDRKDSSEPAFADHIQVRQPPVSNLGSLGQEKSTDWVKPTVKSEPLNDATAKSPLFMNPQVLQFLDSQRLSLEEALPSQWHHAEGVLDLSQTNVKTFEESSDANSIKTELSPQSFEKQRKNRTNLKIQTKIEIIAYAEQNPKMKQNAIAAHFGIDRTTVSKVLKRKEAILSGNYGQGQPTKKEFERPVEISPATEDEQKNFDEIKTSLSLKPLNNLPQNIMKSEDSDAKSLVIDENDPRLENVMREFIEEWLKQNMHLVYESSTGSKSDLKSMFIEKELQNLRRTLSLFNRDAVSLDGDKVQNMIDDQWDRMINEFIQLSSPENSNLNMLLSATDGSHKRASTGSRKRKMTRPPVRLDSELEPDWQNPMNNNNNNIPPKRPSTIAYLPTHVSKENASRSIENLINQSLVNSYSTSYEEPPAKIRNEASSEAKVSAAAVNERPVLNQQWSSAFMMVPRTTFQHLLPAAAANMLLSNNANAVPAGLSVNEVQEEPKPVLKPIPCKLTTSNSASPANNADSANDLSGIPEIVDNLEKITSFLLTNGLQNPSRNGEERDVMCKSCRMKVASATEVQGLREEANERLSAMEVQMEQVQGTLKEILQVLKELSGKKPTESPSS